ncbi:MAG: hypothetical protein MUF07_13240 [Steroidobacteraceae bacterium]|jgi:hypothetical protein|nr:hypothetical protein [Steroidobacteraceae bacterium]
MPRYRVSWAAVIEAGSPLQAARDAFARQVAADQPSRPFLVRGPDGATIVDLDTGTEAPSGEPPFVDEDD